MAKCGIRIAAALGAALLLAGAPAALAEKRVALVVGIDAYPNLKADQQLRKAVNDARSVAETLRTLDYDVVVGENVTGFEFDRLWQSFLNRVEPGDLTAFYFSGHGVQLRDGVNYLLPRDVPAIASGEETFLKRQSVSFAELQHDLRNRGARVSLMILDACRDDPFAEPGTKSVVGARGLTRVDPPEGSFVMFSAGAGESALDRLSEQDDDPNSVYTRRLLPLLRTTGLALPEVAERVREEVHALARTSPAHRNHKQVPAYYSNIIGRFCMAGCDKEAGSRTPPLPATDPVAADYAQAAQIDTLAGWDAFLAAHGAKADSFHVKLARAARQKLALAVPSPPQPEPAPIRHAPAPRSGAVQCRSGLSTDNFTYCVSSILTSQLGNTYKVDNLADESGSTAWVEGRPGEGIGEWILVDFGEERTVQELRIRNGYAKNEDIFGKNGRVRSIALSFSGGEEMEAELTDSSARQSVALRHPVRARWVRIRITGVYSGWKYRDTAISELRVVTSN